MYTFRCLIVALALLALGARTQDSQDVEALVQKLGASEIAVREAATRDLLAKGQAIRPALDKAARSPDGEIAARAKSILATLDRRIDAINIVFERLWKDPNASLHRKFRDSTHAFQIACQGLDPEVISKSLERQGFQLLENKTSYQDEKGKEYLARAGAYISPGGIHHDLLLRVWSKPQPSKTDATKWVLHGSSVVLVARPEVEFAEFVAKPYPADTVFRLAFDHAASHEAAASYPIVREMELSYVLIRDHHEEELYWRFHVALELTNRDLTAGTRLSFRAASGLDPGELHSGEKLEAGFVSKDTIEGFEGGIGGSWGSLVKSTDSHSLRRIEEKKPEEACDETGTPVVYGAGDLKSLPEGTGSLTIRGKEFDADDCKGLNRLAKLRSLEWWYKKPIAGIAIEHLAKLKSLETLDLIGWGSATDADLERLATLPRLKKLSLSDTSDVTDAGAAHLAKLASLSELHLHWCKSLTDAAIKSFSELKKLETLHLWGAGNLTDEGLEHISRITQLRNLTLSHSKNFTAKGWGHVAKLPSVKYITLGYLSMDDQGLSAIGRMSSLEGIELDGLKNLSDAGLRGLKGLSQLRSLILWECPGITTQGLNELQASIPGKYRSN